MNQENWFYTPIWYEHTSINTELMVKKCLYMRRQNYPSRVISNAGGWQSQTILFNEHLEFDPLYQLLLLKIDELQEKVGGGVKFGLDNAWVNINEKGDCNRKHIHGQTVFSGVFYVQVDELTGKINFYNDYSPIQHYPIKFDKSNIFHSVVEYVPQNGMLIIFPAWLPHDVSPSQSEQSRISVAFNIKQIN